MDNEFYCYEQLTESGCLNETALCAWCLVDQNCYYINCEGMFNIKIDGIIDYNCSKLLYSSTDIDLVCTDELFARNFLVLILFCIGWFFLLFLCKYRHEIKSVLFSCIGCFLMPFVLFKEKMEERWSNYRRRRERETIRRENEAELTIELMEEM